MNTTPVPITQRPSVKNNDPNCYVEFNGQDVDLYKYGQDDNTNTYGRSGFSIHGGLTKGSAGCIY